MLIADRWIQPIIAAPVLIGLGLTALACSDHAGTPTANVAGVPAPVLQPPLRVFHNPYAEVDWQSDARLKVQLHDHVGVAAAGIRSYDSAGYDAMSLMTYSGVASMSYAWHERRWPPEKWLPASLLSSLKHIRFFIPNGEEVGYGHVTSPMLTTYIAKYEPAYDSVDELWDYGGPSVPWGEGTQQEISQIRRYGGFPIIAHPVEGWDSYKDLREFRGMEVYSGYVTFKLYEGVDAFYSVDRNADMQANWDAVLSRDDRVIGVAVNDHFGPDNTSVPAKLRDTGKTIILAHSSSLAALADALNRGAAFAVKDIAAVKGQYPSISAITATDTSITIQTSGSVTWIGTGGKRISAGASLYRAELPLGETYVRAVIFDTLGNEVYTQAFSIRSVLDTNGDRIINTDDDLTCLRVDQGADTDADEIGACQARAAYLSRVRGTGTQGD